ncbi:MAG TPA: hypothetical protein DCS19_01360 [Flavobacterium sp.]|nr:hypothetical protein [Flavobacterium sp.]
MTGTPIDIGFYSTTGLPIESTYLNVGTAYISEAEVLATIDIGSRHDGMKVRIGLYDYEFKADLTTLEMVAFANDQTASEVPIVDAASIYDATNVEDALAEVMAFAISLDIDIQSIINVKTNPYQINLPTGDLSAKIAGATFSPTGWATVSLIGGSNMLITHTLTGRKIAFVNVFEIDGSNEDLQSFDKGTAYTGIRGNGSTVLISGCTPTLLAARIELMFN